MQAAGRPFSSLKDLPFLAGPSHYGSALIPLLHGINNASHSRSIAPFSASILVHTRGFAGQAKPSGVPQGAYQTPAGGGRASSVRVTMVSSNLLAEPYKGEPPALPLSSWVSPTGWKERWRRWMGGVKSIYTIAKLRKNVKGWSLPNFKEEALDIYEQACSALAAGDRTELRQLVSPAIFSDMKKQIKAREDGGWKRVDWALTHKPTLKEIEVVQGRLISIDPKNDNTGFAQLTVRFKCRQKFSAYDGKGRLVAGSEEKDVPVDDFWVFERPLKEQMSNRWRVAGRLMVPRDGYLAR